MPRRTHAERGILLGGLAGFVLLCVALLEAAWWKHLPLWASVASLPTLVAGMTGTVDGLLLFFLFFVGPPVQWGLLGFLVGRAADGRRRSAGIGLLVFAGCLFVLAVWALWAAQPRWWWKRDLNAITLVNLAIALAIWTTGVTLLASRRAFHHAGCV